MVLSAYGLVVDNRVLVNDLDREIVALRAYDASGRLVWTDGVAARPPESDQDPPAD